MQAKSIGVSQQLVADRRAMFEVQADRQRLRRAVACTGVTAAPCAPSVAQPAQVTFRRLGRPARAQFRTVA
jgi:hypothetical protein